MQNTYKSSSIVLKNICILIHFKYIYIKENTVCEREGEKASEREREIERERERERERENECVCVYVYTAIHMSVFDCMVFDSNCIKYAIAISYNIPNIA